MRFARTVELVAPLIAAALGSDAPVLAVMRPEGRAWRPGERLRQPALAATLERLATDGFAALYDGELADRQAGGLASAGCSIRVDDLAAHASTWTDPIGVDYRGVRVTTHPPNSSGIVALQILSVLSRFEPPRPEAFGADGVTD